MALWQWHRLMTMVAVLLAAPLPVRAVEPAASSPGEQCMTAIAAAELRYETPPGLLAAMAKVESGRPVGSGGSLQPWPWTVDADGRGIFFPTKAEAVAWSRDALASGAVTYLDVGCMQVDLRMHPSAFTSLEQAFDPAVNAAYGARFLRQLYDGAAAGNWFAAV